jgi:ankyrin repeat protein
LELPHHVSEFLLNSPSHDWPTKDMWITPEPISSGHLAAFLGLKSYLLQYVELSTVTAKNRFTLLHIAAIGGYVDTAEAIIRKWPALSPHDPSSEGKTPFMLAAGYGHIKLLELFLSNSSNKLHLLNSRASCGCTVLACAVRQNQQLAVRFLVPLSGIDVNAAACHTGLTPLAWAASTEDVIIINQLLSNPRLDINLQSSQTGRTALLEACHQDDIPIVRLFMSRPDLDVNAGPRCGCTPLTVSISRDRQGVIPLLLSRPDINLHARCQFGPTFAPSYLWAPEWVSRLILTHPRLFENASHADIQLCLRRAAELGVESTVKDILSKVLAAENLRPDPSVLIGATKAGQKAIVEMLVEYADVNAEDEFGCTALAEAATLDIATLLVFREDILINKGSHPPLITASRRGHASIVRLLLHHRDIDVNVQDTDGQVSLAWAIDAEHWDVVDMLLAMPTIDVNRGTCPALIKACGKGREILVQKLLDREGIDVNVEDAEGWSPLARAAFTGHESICNSLLCRPELKLTGGSVSPFVQAAGSGSEAIVRLFLSHVPRCDPNDVDVDADGGHTALSVSARHGFSEIVELLICRPEVDVNLGIPTPLMQACIGGQSGIIRLLLSRYSDALDVNVRDEHYSFATALWYACYSRKGSPEIVQLLLERPDLDVNIGLTFTGPMSPDHGEDQPPIVDYNARRLSTPLHAACIRRPRAAQALLATPGIDVAKMNEYGQTALAVVLDQDPTSEAVDYLLSRPEPLAGVAGHNLLVYAAGLAPSTPSEEEALINVMKKILLIPRQMLDINMPEPVTGLTALSAACLIHGSVGAVSYLLSLPAIDPNCGTPPPLVQASISGDVDIFAMLLRHPQTDPNIKSERGYTALGEACSHGSSLEAIELLVSWPGVDVNAGKHSPLAIAVYNGNTAAAELLLQNLDTDVSCRVPRPPSLAKRNLPFETMNVPSLYQNLEPPSPPKPRIQHGAEFVCNHPIACLGGPYSATLAHDPLHENIGIFNPPVEQLDAYDEACDPILVYCTKSWPRQVVLTRKLLLRDDLDVNATGDCSCTALIWASQLCKQTIVNTLLDRDKTAVDVRCFYHGHTALLAAAHRMKFQLVHTLLSHPRSHEINPNAFTNCGCNLLVCASRSGDEDTVRSILPFTNWHEYPNAQDCKFGRTALLWASYFGHDSLVQLFLPQPEVWVDHRDKRGHTALMLAASGGHEDVVRSLLSSSRVNNTHVCDLNGDTALSLAKWYGHKDIVRLLEWRDFGDDEAGISELLSTITLMVDEREGKQGELDVADVGVGGPPQQSAVPNALNPLSSSSSPLDATVISYASRSSTLLSYFRSAFLFLIVISIFFSSFMYFALRIDAGYDMLAEFWRSELYSVSTRILSCLVVA